MNISMKWLSEYVLAPQDMDVFCDAMTMSGTKVERAETSGKDIELVVLGEILSIEAHPDAERLVVTQVNVGSETIQVVTGAKNVSVGDYIPVALHGASLAGDLKIKKGKLRGVESNGMMCSVEELGLSREDFPEAPENGIYLFDKEELKTKGYSLGDDVKPLFGLDDTVVEYEITSNRADCFSVLGVAREVAATFDRELKMPNIGFKEVSGNIQEMVKISVEADDLCYRYLGKIVKNVKVEPSPKWFQEKIRSAGLRPINNIVDITNFVMLETGQPMHAFDLEKVGGAEIIVRRAKAGEVMKTLDETERVLDESMLVIADKNRATGIAGVMGGEDSKITAETTTILFEAANFNGTNIRHTSKKLGLRSDSSSRFEKHLDPNLVEFAMHRACALIDELNAGQIVEGQIDIYPNPRTERKLSYDVAAINQILGTELSEQEMTDIFRRLTFQVDMESKTVIIPTYRADIEGMADLAEEVARIYGYNEIPTTISSKNPTVGHKTISQKAEDMVISTLLALGANEAVEYSFESPKVFEKLRLPQDHPYRRAMVILNPLGEDFSMMRTSMLNGILTSLSTNYNRRNSDVTLFEIGRVYLPTALPVDNSDKNAEMPTEKNCLVVGHYGKKDFFDMKGMAETLAIALGETFSYQPSAHSFFHPNRQADIICADKRVGYLGEIHPLVADNYEIGAKPYVLMLDLDAVVDHINLSKKYEPIPKYPAVSRDLALLVKEDVLAGEIEGVFAEESGKLLEKAELFDLYQGEQIEKGYKSMAYALKLRAKDHTLTENEINQVLDRILRKLDTTFGIRLRD
ncbi:phenylalanine--tRNA ligase subunit beta [Clostridiales bacterium COT073_COT-073]|nr:phenylalanine--tRNA ligase subunit beta [Clostridiales bacterium COT073_COT-073]